MNRLVFFKLFFKFNLKLLVFITHFLKILLHGLYHRLVVLIQRRYFNWILHNLGRLNNFILARLHLFDWLLDLASGLILFTFVLLRQTDQICAKFAIFTLHNFLTGILWLYPRLTNLSLTIMIHKFIKLIKKVLCGHFQSSRILGLYVDNLQVGRHCWLDDLLLDFFKLHFYLITEFKTSILK